MHFAVLDKTENETNFNENNHNGDSHFVAIRFSYDNSVIVVERTIRTTPINYKHAHIAAF